MTDKKQELSLEELRDYETLLGLLESDNSVSDIEKAKAKKVLAEGEKMIAAELEALEPKKANS